MTILCAISGEIPQSPVISRKSGSVYERRLVEAYISENGTEPATGESITIDDLMDVQSSQTVRPRPPTMTSIPALLGTFQQEWDSLALEVYNLRQNLVQTRQELSTALYQNDAAIRVIARLTKERDEAREALSRVNVGATNGVNGDAMHVDSAPLPPQIIAKIEATQESLMKTRKKRPVPEEWATADSIASYKPISAVAAPAGTSFLSIGKDGRTAVVGGQSGEISSLLDGSITSVANEGEALSAGSWAGSRIAVATASGKVKIIENGQNVAEFQNHSGTVRGLAVHPTGDIIASVSADKSYSLYDLESNSVLTQVFANSELTCTCFHPDGHLLAVAGTNKEINIYDVKNGTIGGKFELATPATALCFSENGYWLASASEESSVVSIWDLRKTGPAALVQSLECGGQVDSLDWDYTAQFLLAAGPGGITVQQYTKASKSWSQVITATVAAKVAVWGENAQNILVADEGGNVTVLGLS